MRLQKYMAHCGVASRRKSEEYISQGRVKVNGLVIRNQGYIVKEGDTIEVNNKKIHFENNKIYIALNKPRGVLSTAKDEKGRKTVMDCLKSTYRERLYPVGRLDRDSSGLILLTNDGEITQRLLHPKHGVNKRYTVTIEGKLDEKEILTLNKGILLEDGMTAPAKFEILEVRQNKTRLTVTIHEGRNRQIRRMFKALGYEVVFLERIQLGPIGLGNLGKGQYRELTAKEVEKLKQIQ